MVPVWETDQNYLETSTGVFFPLHPAVTYAAAEHQGFLFWITCKWLKLLRKAGRFQLIQNSAPSVAGRRQCCMISLWKVEWISHKICVMKNQQIWILPGLFHSFRRVKTRKIMNFLKLWKSQTENLKIWEVKLLPCLKLVQLIIFRQSLLFTFFIQKFDRFF